MQGYGTLIFRKNQPFVSTLSINDSSGYKGLGYEAYADSTMLSRAICWDGDRLSQ
jgi:hypothetical protein